MLGPEPVRIHPVLYLLIGLFGLVSLFILAPLWSFVLGGLLVGYLGYPLYRRLRPHFSRKDVPAGLALLFLLIIVLVPAVFLGYQLVLETQRLVRGFTAGEAQQLVDALAFLTNQLVGWPSVQEGQSLGEALLAELVPRAREAVLAWLPNAAGLLARVGLGLTVVVFIAYYTLRDGDRLVAFIEDVLPLEDRTEQRILDDIALSLDGVVFGQVLTAVAQGVLAGIGFWIFGVPSPVLWGFVSAVLSLLPLVGPPLVWGPAAAFLLGTGATGRGIGLLIWGALVVSTSDNVLRPKLMSEHSGMHPAIALVGVLGGLVAFGFMGFLLGPVVLTLSVTLLGIYTEQRQEAAARTKERDALLEDLSQAVAVETHPPPTSPEQGTGAKPDEET